MNEVCSKDSINWLKYGNFITTNNTHIYEERTILRNGNKNWFNIINEKNNKKVRAKNK